MGITLTFTNCVMTPQSTVFALSRLKPGFNSPWEHQLLQSVSGNSGFLNSGRPRIAAVDAANWAFERAVIV
jgi:hypothetical protein